MKIKEGYILRNVAGYNVVVPVGDAALDFNGMINLNETGAFLWKAMTEETDEKTLVSALLEEYDTNEETAAADVAAFVKKMRDAELIDG